MKTSSFTGGIFLFLAAFFWGSTFVAQSSATESLPTFSYLAARSYVGAGTLFLFLLFLFLQTKRTEKASALATTEPFIKKSLFKKGFLCGTLLFFGSAFQQYGIEKGAGAGEAGFLTALYMFLVPMIEWIFEKKKAGIHVLFGALLTIIGLYCLLENGFHLGVGQGLVVLCSLFFAFHIFTLGHFQKENAIALSFVQFTVCALYATLFSLVFDRLTFSEWAEGLQNGWFPVLYAGIFSSAIAYTLQIAGQKRTAPAVASVILSGESVVALLTEWICARLGFVGEPFHLGALRIFGCILSFFGILLAQISFKELFFRKKSENLRKEKKK